MASLAENPDPAGSHASALQFPADFSRSDFDALLHRQHPRLFAHAADWERLRTDLPSHPNLQAVARILEQSASEILEQPPQTRVMNGRRLLSVSREVLRRVLTLGSMYRLSGDERYFTRAREELMSAAAFSDWNPSHFLDVAEMTLAVAVGYDWLYHDLSESDRATFRQAIVEKGLKPGTESHWWKQSDNNWPQVCYGGLVAGALAVGDREPALAVELLRDTFANIHRPLDAYAPDGAYPEGPAYWNYGTHYQIILISVLESALDTSWGLENYPAFQESATYMNLMIGPSGRFFNYADGGSEIPPLPALHWFASRAGNPVLDAHERKRLESVADPLDSSLLRNRFFPLALWWLAPTLEASESTQLPLHWRADGPNPISVHRSSWESDGLFFGIKGGTPSVNHGHMDIGSFILDWMGVRWAHDLGAQNYNSLESLGMQIWNRAQTSDRWRVFRLNTLSHNTLVIDDEQQRVDGFAPITQFSDDPNSSFTVVDMTEVYAHAVEGALRRAEILPSGELLIRDELTGLTPDQTVRWAMVTEADIKLLGDRAILRQDGQTLHIRITAPETAAFAIIPTDPPPNKFDTSNPGTRMLAFTVKGNQDQRRKLEVIFSPPRSE